jgi:hypothetical protein
MGINTGVPAVDRPGLWNFSCIGFTREDVERCTLITHLPALGVNIFWANDGVVGGELLGDRRHDGGTQLWTTSTRASEAPTSTFP